jgi:gas vesicle protein
MSTSKFFAGALLGLVAGLLLAPEKGEDLRNNIAGSADKWKRKFNRMTGKTGAELDDLRNLLEEQIEGLNDDVRYRLITILEESKDSARNIRDDIAAEFS